MMAAAEKPLRGAQGWDVQPIHNSLTRCNAIGIMAMQRPKRAGCSRRRKPLADSDMGGT
jgi:hypothetical protein